MAHQTVLSIIVPVYSGAAYVQELFEQISQLKNKWETEQAPLRLGELIFVNDQSIDASVSVLTPITQQHAWVHLLHLSKNFGQHPASMAGILHSSGHWVITLDEDLQHPPTHIEAMLLKALNEDLDVVYAAPSAGPHGKISRDFSSSFFKKLMVRLTGDKNIALFNSFRLMRGEIARSAASVCGPDTYFDVALTWFTKNMGALEVPIQDIRTVQGQGSGYSFRKLLAHARRLLLTAQINAYRAIAALGIAIFLLGVVFSGYILVNELIQPGSFGSRGWPSLIITTMIFGATSVILLALILEYLSIVVQKAQGKPVFFVIDRKADPALIAYLQHGHS